MKPVAVWVWPSQKPGVMLDTRQTTYLCPQTGETTAFCTIEHKIDEALVAWNDGSLQWVNLLDVKARPGPDWPQDYYGAVTFSGS